VLDALKEGFRVKALENAMRAVDVNPGDGERAIAEMRAAGAELVKTQGQEAEKQGQEAGAEGM
jgi:nicotinamidase/pyrazinamidase